MVEMTANGPTGYICPHCNKTFKLQERTEWEQHIAEEHGLSPDGKKAGVISSYYMPAEKMTLRDYFAAGVAAAVFSGEDAEIIAMRDRRYTGDNWSEVVAMNAYEMADAMLKEREK